MPLKLALTAAFALLSLALPARAEHYDLFLLAGQSNMDGRAKVAALTGDLAHWKKPQPDVIIAYSNSGTRTGHILSADWTPLIPGYSVRTGKPPIDKIPGETFGPEVAFGRTLADALHSRIALLKFVEGGTSLKKNWRVGEPSGLYAQMLPFYRKQLDALTARGDTYTLRGFAWHQGESDASLTKDEYLELLKNLITHLREDMHAPDLPVVLGEVYDNHKRDSILAAQREAPTAIPHCAQASSAHLNTLDKGTHFDAPSQLELGKRMAEALLPLLKDASSH
ncbi:MAG: sialate O-acetylesterase [Phycisphaerae bacterium]